MIHGTRPMIERGCVCNLCTLVRENPMSGTRPATASVPTGAARTHLDTLVASGWTIRTLAQHTGYGTSTLYAIRGGRWQFTSREIVEDILSVTPMAVAA